MLVKKINPEWKPSEKPDLKVGETIEISDPKTLILSGVVKAVDAEGMEVSSYDLYGVITKDEREEFEEWKKINKQNALKSKMEKEIADLKEEAAKIEKKPEVKTEVKKEATVDPLASLKSASKAKK